ncbi:helix-turn-helix domain-containing protein [Actinomycetota bacterium Odt1-20B]
MMVTRYTTEELPAAERFGWWHDLTAQALIPTSMGSDHAADFRARARVLDLGRIQVTSLAYAPVTVARTPHHIRRRDPDYFQLSLTVRGGHALSQDRRDAVSVPGELLLYDSAREFHGGAVAADGGDTRVEQIVAQFPKALVPLPADAVHRLVARRLPCDAGFGALLAQFLTHTSAHADAFRAQDAPRLSRVLLDLFGGLVADVLDAEGQLPPESRENTLFLQIQDFVQEHLGDPGLTAAAVAAAHHVSLRTLHRLCQAHGVTAAAWIRAQRLERCRRDLADPLQAHRPIHAIAAHAGFRRPGDLTRAFHAAYGVSPRAYRDGARSEVPGTDC